MASCSDPPTCCPSSGWRPSTSRCGCSKRRSASARYCSAAPTRSGRSTVSVKAAGVGRSTPVPALPAACCSSRSALLPAASTGTARRCSSPRSPWRCSGSGLLWRVSSPVPAVALPASSRPLLSCSTSSSGSARTSSSFARLAAFGLTHAALGQVIWQGTTALWRPGPVTVGAALLFVAGNVLAFALEALVAGVQALRLEYYELFSRVFESEGQPFRPWHIPVAESEVTDERVA